MSYILEPASTDKVRATSFSRLYCVVGNGKPDDRKPITTSLFSNATFDIRFDFIWIVVTFLNFESNRSRRRVLDHGHQSHL